MKLNSFLPLIALCCLPAFTAHAQDKHYLVVTYLQLPSGKGVEDYIAAEKLRMRLHQKAVNEGHIRGWFLYRVEGGKSGQLVVAEVPTSLDSHGKGRPASLAEGLFTPEEMAQLNRADAQRKMLRTELWEIATLAHMAPTGGNPVKLDVQFFNPKEGREADYLQFEDQVIRPIQQARIDARAAQSWILFRRVMPAGVEVDYNYVTLTGYHENDDVEDVDPAGLSAEQQEAVGRAGELRTSVARERWIPVFHVFAPTS